MGGSLAAMFGFYASLDGRFAQNGNPVRIFTFAAAIPGRIDFARAFQHQERSGLLQHLRISNDNDIVPLSKYLLDEHGPNKARSLPHISHLLSSLWCASPPPRRTYLCAHWNFALPARRQETSFAQVCARFGLVGDTESQLAHECSPELSLDGPLLRW